MKTCLFCIKEFQTGIHDCCSTDCYLQDLQARFDYHDLNNMLSVLEFLEDSKIHSKYPGRLVVNQSGAMN